MNVLKTVLFSASVLSGTGMFAQNHPNLILFLVDDMGLMDTSVPFITDKEGNPQRYPLNDWYRTPNMERLAEQGICFTTFYAQSVSSPSRTSILTGQNAARHRTTNWIDGQKNNCTEFGPRDWNWDGIAETCPVYPKLLQKAGYRTIHVGKAHFGNDWSVSSDPLTCGFDINIGGCSHGEPGSYLGENAYGWTGGNRMRAVPGLEKYHGSSVFLTDALTMEAEEQITECVKEGVPFYLNMSHYAVHKPFEADPRFISHYKGSGKGEKAEAFATLIEGMDKSLGDLMDRLEELGVAENTLIIFLGDNGGDAPLGAPEDYGSSAPLRGKKGTVYEGGTRVPFIAAWAKPDEDNVFQQRYPVAQGAVQNQMATVMDLYPTILNLAGAGLPENYIIDGSDLGKLLAGKKDMAHRTDFLCHFPHGEHNSNYYTTYRVGNWKLIYRYNPDATGIPTVELYDLTDDPFETTDLSKERPRLTDRLIRKMISRLEEEDALYPIDADGNPLRPHLLSEPEL